MFVFMISNSYLMFCAKEQWLFEWTLCPLVDVILLDLDVKIM